ncbi:hypothetical protein A4X13_0g144 [Tilletia indica]|uniref:Uncharacterized protein n=1 Tax=Tilletia indica TaxID=43049 RepID=A0A177TME2_9BASI|nr:hypothetical protein A4X13_0g144 [Tilletia indica]
MVYFTPAKAVNALTVSLAVAALATDAVQARPAYTGTDGPSAQLQPQGRMQKVVLRSNPPPPLPAGVQTDGSASNSRRSFAEQGNFKRSKAKAAGANDRVFRRSEAGSKRSPSKQVHEHIHIHEHGNDRGHGRHGHDHRHGHDRGAVVIDDRVRHHSTHWAEHHGLIPSGSSKPTLVQIGNKGTTVYGKVVSAFPAAGKIVAAIPKQIIPMVAVIPKKQVPMVAVIPKKVVPAVAVKPKKVASKKKSAKAPKAGKGKRRHDDRYDDEYHSEHAHIHEHDHGSEDGHEHVHEHEHSHHKREQAARITLGNDGQLYRSSSKYEGDLLSLHLRSETPGLASDGSFNEDGTELEADTDGTPLSKRRHGSKGHYYYDDDYWRGDYGDHAHVHAHIHDHSHRRGRDDRHRHGHGHHHGHSHGSSHVHEHIHAHKRGGTPPTPADTSAVNAKVGQVKAGTPIGAVDASDITGVVGKAQKPAVPHHPTGNKSSPKGSKKHNLNTLASKVRPAPARNAPHPAAAGAFVDSAQLTHTLAERGLLGGLLKPLLAPLNALPGFITISDLLFGDDNVLKKVAALVLHAEPAKGGMPAGPGNVLAAAPPYKYTLMSSTDERTQVYLVPADAPNTQKGVAAQQSFAAVMNATAMVNGNATTNPTNETVIVKIVVPLLNATTGIPATWCATFASKPPSPLELQPCTGTPLAGTIKNGSSLLVVPEVAGKSQRFQYTPTTGALSPLYEREMIGTLKQVMAVKPNNGDASADDSSDVDDVADDADDVDFFGDAVDGSDASASDSDSGNGLYRQLAVDTTMTSDDDSAADPDSDLNDPAGGGVSGFSDVDDAASAENDEDDSSSQDTVSPLNAKAKTQAPGPAAGVQLKFVPAGSWGQQFAAAAPASPSTTDDSADSTTATDPAMAEPTSTDTDSAPTSTADAVPTVTADPVAPTATDLTAPDAASTSSSAMDAPAPSSTSDAPPAAAPSQRR